jgi:hypothetical protein
MDVEGATTWELFHTYVEHFLAQPRGAGPGCRDGKPRSFRPKRVWALIEERGCKLLYLSPYSPNPTLIRGSVLKAQAHPQSIGALARRL